MLKLFCINFNTKAGYYSGKMFKFVRFCNLPCTGTEIDITGPRYLEDEGNDTTLNKVYIN